MMYGLETVAMTRRQEAKLEDAKIFTGTGGQLRLTSLETKLERVG